MNSYVRGDTFRLYCDAYSLALALTDPGTLTLILESPETKTELERTHAGGHIVKEATGVFYYELTIAADAELGIWDYRWTATGAVKALREGSFEVVASRLDD